LSSQGFYLNFSGAKFPEDTRHQVRPAYQWDSALPQALDKNSVVFSTALDGFVPGDVEKDQQLKLIKHLSGV
jgi:hypothetical protein